MLPYPDHIKAQMCKGKNKRDDQQNFTFFPTDGLLMPESRDHTKDGKDDPDHIQSQMTVAVSLIVFQLAMLVRAEPRFPQHEPRRSITSVLFTYQ